MYKTSESNMSLEGKLKWLPYVERSGEKKGTFAVLAHQVSLLVPAAVPTE
jgi:hypothetical protein